MWRRRKKSNTIFHSFEPVCQSLLVCTNILEEKINLPFIFLLKKTFFLLLKKVTKFSLLLLSFLIFGLLTGVNNSVSLQIARLWEGLLLCLFRLPYTEKDFSHWGQLCPFSLLWINLIFLQATRLWEGLFTLHTFVFLLSAVSQFMLLQVTRVWKGLFTLRTFVSLLPTVSQVMSP